MDDAQIISMVLAGDRAKYEKLVLKYQSRVFYTAMNITKNREFAEDISQDAFIKALEKLSTLQDREQFYSWLKRITINLSLNHYDTAKRLVDVESENFAVSYFDNIADDNNPEDYLIKDELRRYVKMYVDALPDRLRKVMIMREVEDLNYEEIADFLDIPVGTVRSRLFNARQIVKQRLVKQGLINDMLEEAK